MGGTARLSFFCGLRSKAVHPGEFVLKPANPINQFGRRRHNGHLLASVVWLDEACLNVMILDSGPPRGVLCGTCSWTCLGRAAFSRFANTESRPDVWIYYSGQWPFGSDSLERCRLFFADLLDEMEAMAGDMDRCRWLGKCTSSGCIGTPNACLGSLIALVGFELVYPRRHHFRLARTPLHSVNWQTWPMSAVG